MYEDNTFDQIYIFLNCSEFYYDYTKMHTNITVALKPDFFEFLVVEWCISLKMQFRQALFKFHIFIIAVEKCLLFSYLV